MIDGNPGTEVVISGSLDALNSWLNSTTALSYSPVSQVNGVGADSLRLQINDNGNTGAGGGTSVDLGSVRIDVISVNDEPSGSDATLQTNEDQSLVLLASNFGFTDVNDDFFDSNSLNGVLISTLPAAGTLSLSGIPVLAGATVSIADINAGLLLYTPDENGRGLAYAQFDFQVQDDGGTSNGGVDLDAIANTLVIDVLSINDAPQGEDLTVTTAEDTDYVIQTADLGYSDVADGDQLQSIEIVGLPVNGTLALGGLAVVSGQQITSTDIASGNLVFSPDPQTHGIAHSRISFVVTDDGGLPGVDTAVSANTLTIDVTAVNDAPTGQDRTVVTDEDVPFIFSAADFGFVDTFDATDTLAGVLISSLPDRGQLTVNGNAVSVGDVVSVTSIDNGEFQYLAAANENGIDYSRFLFQVQDDNLQPGDNTDPIARQLAINVSPVSDAPAGQDGQIATLEDSDYVLQVSDFGFSDINDADDLVGVFIDQLPGAGTLILRSVETDANGISEDESVEVVVGQFIAEADIVAGLLVYRPDSDVHGNDQLRFRVQDSGNDSNAGSLLIENISLDSNQLDIEVVAVNDAPSGENNTVTTNEDTPHTFVREDFGFSDAIDSSQATDNNHQFSAITIYSLPEAGTLLVNGVAATVGQVVSTADIDAGGLIYIPPENETGTGYNGLGFMVHDDAGTDNGGVDIDPTPNFISFDLPGVNDAPLLLSEGATVAEGNEIVITDEMLFGADADDPDPMELTLTITRLPQNGALLLDGAALGVGDTFTLQAIVDELLSYIHDESETSADAFRVTLRDGGEDGSQPVSGDFNFVVTEVIDPAPEVDNDLLELSFGEDFDSMQGDLLASGFSGLNQDRLIDDSRFTVALEVPPQHGTIELNADGTFEYMHDGSRILLDEFRYRVTNEDGVFTIATVSISIEPPLEAVFAVQPPLAQPTPPTELEPEPEPSPAPNPTSQTEEGVESVERQFEQSADIFGSPASEGTEEQDQVSVLEVLRSVQTDTNQVRVRSEETDTLEVLQHNQLAETTFDADELNTVSSATIELVLEVKLPTVREVASNEGFLNGLSQLDDDLRDAESQTGARYRLAEESVVGVSLSVTVGALAWALRGGAVFASLMTVAPLWASIDLGRIATPVSTRNQSDSETDNADEHSVEEIFDKG